MPDEVRRFPPPWDIEEFDRSCFIVRDNNGQALAYVYFEADPGGARRPIYLPATKHGGSPPILRRYRSADAETHHRNGDPAGNRPDTNSPGTLRTLCRLLGQQH